MPKIKSRRTIIDTKIDAIFEPLVEKEFFVVIMLKNKGGKQGLVKARNRAGVNAYLRKKYGKRLTEVVSIKPRPGWLDYVEEDYI